MARLTSGQVGRRGGGVGDDEGHGRAACAVSFVYAPLPGARRSMEGPLALPVTPVLLPN